jgi:multiple antibiotic resistance protein
MALFFSATKTLSPKERTKIAIIAVSVAIGLSGLFLFFGSNVLSIMHIELKDFQVAGGIILIILGIQMAIGRAVKESEKFSHQNAKAIAAIIGTPLLTGPATITAIIVSKTNEGILITGLALAIVFAFTFLLLYFSPKITKYLGPNITQVITTLLGMVTISYGVIFIRSGLGF